MEPETANTNEYGIAASTPSTNDNSKRGTKRTKTRHPGSESSIDGDLSYLDLDSGKILAASREANQIILSQNDFDKLMSKIDKMEENFSKIGNIEKSLGKLEKLDKLDAIEKNVRDMNLKVSDMDTRLHKVEHITKELKDSTQFLSNEYDSMTSRISDNKKSLSDNNKDIRALVRENEELKQSLDDIRDLHHQLKEQLLDTKCREMRDNLVFHNIAEKRQTNKFGKIYEDTESVLSEFLSRKLEIENIKFERVHRMPTNFNPDKATTKPRPIVAKFSYFKDRETVRRSGYKLRGTTYGINEQFPEEIVQKRRELYPIAQHFREQNKHVVLVRDRLFVDGKEVRAGDVVLPSRPPTMNRTRGGGRGGGRGSHRTSDRRRQVSDTGPTSTYM